MLGLEHTALRFILYVPLTVPTPISESGLLDVSTVFIKLAVT